MLTYTVACSMRDSDFTDATVTTVPLANSSSRANSADISRRRSSLTLSMRFGGIVLIVDINLQYSLNLFLTIRFHNITFFDEGLAVKLNAALLAGLCCRNIRFS